MKIETREIVPEVKKIIEYKLTMNRAEVLVLLRALGPMNGKELQERVIESYGNDTGVTENTSYHIYDSIVRTNVEGN